MRKYIHYAWVLLCIMLACSPKAMAQDDGSNVVLTAYVSDQIENFPPEAADMLSNKLRQIVTQSGVGANSNYSRFIVTANVNVMGKDILPGPPPQHAYNLDVTLYIGDGIAGKKFASKSVSVKGVGTSETKAYIDAIRKINANDPNLKAFVEDGKNRIVDYYNNNCDLIVREAQAMAGRNDFEGAIAQLISVPPTASGCYGRATSLTNNFYQKYIDRQCKIKLVEARSRWAATQNTDGASYVAEILSTIDPNAPCYREAVNFSQEVGKRIKDLDKREWDFKMKQFDSNVQVSKALVDAYREIAVIYGKNQPQTMYNIRGWW
jgi:hypothetical protein